MGCFRPEVREPPGWDLGLLRLLQPPYCRVSPLPGRGPGWVSLGP